MNVLDLQDVLRERAADGGAELRATGMVAGVHHRYAARRRRRVIAGAAAGLVALALAGGTAVLTDRPPLVNVQPAIASPGFAEFADGFRVVDEAWSRDRKATSVTLTFTPTMAAGVFFVQCPEDLTGFVELTLNGHQILESDNGHCQTIQFDDVTRLKDDYGVKVGQPATLVLHAQAGPLGLAVGDKVPPQDYPYPARPAQLPELKVDPSGEKIAQSKPDPNQPVTTTITWDPDLNLGVVAQTPGAVTVTLNGGHARTQSWWDYSGTDKRLVYTDEFKPGQKVTVTIIPQRFTGLWTISLYH